MGFWDFLFGKTITIQDDFFGNLRFMEIKKHPERSYFEGKKMFFPVNRVVEFSIKAPLSGPSLAQKDFFQEIEKRYPEIIPTVIPIIEDTFRNWKADFRIADFEKEFTLIYLRLPDMSLTPVCWEMAFDTIHDENHQITVYFAGFAPEPDILIDG